MKRFRYMGDRSISPPVSRPTVLPLPGWLNPTSRSENDGLCNSLPSNDRDHRRHRQHHLVSMRTCVHSSRVQNKMNGMEEIEKETHNNRTLWLIHLSWRMDGGLAVYDEREELRGCWMAS